MEILLIIYYKIINVQGEAIYNLYNINNKLSII